MKQKVTLFFLLALLIMGCVPRTWYMGNSEGIFSYDRKTGKVELLWEIKQPEQKPDTLPAKPINSVRP